MKRCFGSVQNACFFATNWAIGPLTCDAMALESVLGQALSRNKVRLKQDFRLETGDVFQGKFQTFARLMRKSISGKREKFRTCESVRIFSVESRRTVN